MTTDDNNNMCWWETKKNWCTWLIRMQCYNKNSLHLFMIDESVHTISKPINDNDLADILAS